jgi:hypothetical protein
MEYNPILVFKNQGEDDQGLYTDAGFKQGWFFISNSDGVSETETWWLSMVRLKNALYA